MSGFDGLVIYHFQRWRGKGAMKCNSSPPLFREKESDSSGVVDCEVHRRGSLDYVRFRGKYCFFFENRAFSVCAFLATGLFGFCAFAGRPAGWMNEWTSW